MLRMMFARRGDPLQEPWAQWIMAKNSKVDVIYSATKAYGGKNQGETGGHKDNSLYAMKQTKGMELAGNAPIPDQHHPVVIW